MYKNLNDYHKMFYCTLFHYFSISTPVLIINYSKVFLFRDVTPFDSGVVTTLSPFMYTLLLLSWQASKFSQLVPVSYNNNVVPNQPTRNCCC